jgi:hypothetical protein
MEHITPEKNIKYLVLSTISRLKKMGVDTSDYVWLLQIAIEFYSEQLRGFNMPSLVSEEIPVNLQNRIWAFPPDLMAVQRLAYKSGDGRLWELSPDINMDLTNEPSACGIPEYNNTATGAIWNSAFWASGFSGTMYASRGNLNTNYYRIDYEKRRVVFMESVPVGVGVVEYLSAGKDVGEDTIIPLTYIDSMRKYLIWQAFENSPLPLHQQTSKDKERQYNEALFDANTLTKVSNIRELLYNLYEESGFSLR